MYVSHKWQSVSCVYDIAVKFSNHEFTGNWSPASYKRKVMLTAVLLPVNLQWQWVSSQGSWKLLLCKWMMATSSNEWNRQKKDQSSQLQKLHYFQTKQLSTTAVLHCNSGELQCATAVVLNSCSAAPLRNLHRLHTHTNK